MRRTKCSARMLTPGDDFKLESYSAFRVATLTLGGLDLGSV